ncbi:aspartate carbamoyltransferase regulatory subunit [Clostridium grantii]|jgi:aspartate carbamoyltransferase regulatory subunit|uniref:Aspartate carbamoyltransferase regulatory subunit n=1 Tax=Clostridium grantii DSM 8605 TaxID=1121316 RepID=A0A1M5WB00_9CLOT|nr:aspartate carbamoyltransferase regulatory subunit [Clostridium grantii]SHH84630.1 aspartate carbamoyltransferase regulatory subunit [Clostridium grantii DSM 8605]
MLNIDSIKNGIVIDHIKSGRGIEIFNFLGLQKAEYSVALIMNVQSKMHERKDIIKIENKIDLNLDVLGLIDSNITVNIIENEKISNKIKLKLPERVENVIKCQNPRCITSIESNVPNKFYLVNREDKEYRCKYCDELYEFYHEGDI